MDAHQANQIAPSTNTKNVMGRNTPQQPNPAETDKRIETINIQGQQTAANIQAIRQQERGRNTDRQTDRQAEGAWIARVRDNNTTNTKINRSDDHRGRIGKSCKHPNSITTASASTRPNQRKRPRLRNTPKSGPHARGTTTPTPRYSIHHIAQLSPPGQPTPFTCVAIDMFAPNPYPTPTSLRLRLEPPWPTG